MVLTSRIIQFTIINTNSPSGNKTCRNQFIIFISYDGHSTFLRYAVDRANPRAIRDWINHSGIEEFDNFLFDNLMNFRVNPSLMLNRRFVIIFKQDFMRAKTRVDTLDIRNLPSDGIFMLLEHI